MHLRRFVPGAAALLSVLATAPCALAQVAPDTAKAFVNQAGQQLVAEVNGNDSTSQKSAALQRLVDQDVAVDQVADFVLGRNRNVATPAQHAQYMSLFHQLLAYNITYQIKAYQGVTFVVNGASVMGNDAVVDTTIARPGQAPVDVGWAVDNVNGGPKIVDVIVAGTSLRVTERDEYASVVTSNGGQVSALLTAMQNQISRIAASQ